MKDWADQLVGERRGLPRVDRREERLCAAEDAGRLRDALGVTCPSGCRQLHRVGADPVLDLVARYARTHGPVPHPARHRSLRGRGRIRSVGAARAARGRGAGRAGRVPSRRRGAGVVRRRRPPPAPPPVAGRPPQGGGTGRRGHAGPLPAALGTASAPIAAGWRRWSRWSAQLQGAPLVASALDRDILRARLAAPRPRRPRRAVHVRRRGVGRGGAIGSTDGRIRLAFRDQAGLLLSPVEGFEPSSSTPPCSITSRRGGRRSGPTSPAPRSRPTSPSTTPACSPRCGTSCGPAWSPTTRSPRCAPSWARSGRRVGHPAPPRGPGRGAALGPVGWRAWDPGRRRALVAGGAAPRPVPTATEAAHARALQLLERYGVLTREAALGEGAEGGFAGVYPVLKALEERGQVRRGYFVAGSARPSSRSPAPSTGSAAERTDEDEPADRVGRHRSGAAVRGGRPVARTPRAAPLVPPARSWCWPGPTRSPTSSAAPTRCCGSRLPRRRPVGRRARSAGRQRTVPVARGTRRRRRQRARGARPTSGTRCRAPGSSRPTRAGPGDRG